MGLQFGFAIIRSILVSYLGIIDANIATKYVVLKVW